MKQKHQILKVLLLISIYCSGMYLSANTSSYFNTHNVAENKEKATYLETASKVFYTHTQQSENSISELTEFSLPSFQLSSDDFLTITYSNKLEFNSKFKQYKNYLNTTRIRHRKSDLIFPFHNFW
ncbi:hypothetical protein MPF19_17905 [Polaribacter sp. Z014]|uniref:hypothetical protein n=1 Tax=unclassified Polaribacter TaxID=196858 RepID=UPI00193BD169|nr:MULTISPECIES: hypothetical protein [unclassified Polaribacter]MCL7765301.1 hypothetical protein [Polaribacter sp. Z014]QVY64901.1 hypothetical protein JOP69_14170 [Polaribacter sp. Q13]